MGRAGPVAAADGADCGADRGGGGARGGGERYLNSDGARYRTLVICLLGAWLLLLGVVAFHQLIRWRHHKRDAEDQHGVRVELLAPRGRMYDRLGRPLTLNRSICSIRILPQHATNKDTLAAILAGFGLGDRRAIRAELRRRKRHFWFRRNVDGALADSLRKVLVKRGYDNCTMVDDDEQRLYPYRDVCAAFTGYLGEERGLAGLECEYDSILRGQPGWKLLQKDAHGYSHPYPSYPTYEPVPGADVHLTVDLDAQEICYEALAAKVRETRALKGSAVVIEAATGRILAVADYPSYDPQRPAGADRERHKCIAVSDVFEPGSVFKIVTAATALMSPNADRLTAQTYDVSKGYIFIGKYKIGDAHNHGVCTFDSLVILSSNPGCALLSMQLEPERFYETARALGFGSAVGIGLPDERSGGIDKPKRLNTLRLANISFGQGMTATLVQLAAAYLCVANDGAYLRPYLIDSVCREGRALRRYQPVRVRQALRPDVALRVKDMLERVITQGTGPMAAIPGVTACGKTGTAQKTEPGGGYSKTRSRMTFIGFLPKESPRYVIAVLVDEPQTDRFASTVAGPVFARIGERLLRLEKMRQSPEFMQIAEGREAGGPKSEAKGQKPKVKAGSEEKAEVGGLKSEAKGQKPNAKAGDEQRAEAGGLKSKAKGQRPKGKAGEAAEAGQRLSAVSRKLSAGSR